VPKQVPHLLMLWPHGNVLADLVAILAEISEGCQSGSHVRRLSARSR
jgi:hypothetical protein